MNFVFTAAATMLLLSLKSKNSVKMCMENAHASTQVMITVDGILSGVVISLHELLVLFLHMHVTWPLLVN